MSAKKMPVAGIIVPAFQAYLILVHRESAGYFDGNGYLRLSNESASVWEPVELQTAAEKHRPAPDRLRRRAGLTCVQ